MFKTFVTIMLLATSTTFADENVNIDLGVVGLKSCTNQDGNFKFLSDLQSILVSGGKKAELEISCGPGGWLPNGDYSPHITTVNLKINSKMASGKNWLGEVPRNFFQDANGLTDNFYQLNNLSYASSAATSGTYLLADSILPDDSGACGKCDKAYIVLIAK